MLDDMSKTTAIKEQARNNSIDNAAAIEPQITTRGQTIGMTQSATNKNAVSKESQNQRSQEKWESQQQG